MKRLIVSVMALVICGAVCMAQNVTIRAVDRPAAEVFRGIVEQTGKNFVYSSDILKGVRVSVDVKDRPLRQTLSIMFKGKGIEYRVKGNNIILKRKKAEQRKEPRKAISSPESSEPETQAEVPTVLQEVVVTSRLEAPAVKTPEIGAKKLTAAEIRKVPVMFGESDVLKALQLQPGIAGGAEGMADMHVHGGNADENMVMLDNVPLYQANHFGGLLSAFNVEAIRYIDFFKSSIPAKYDGRLSSYLDVRTKNGSLQGHHGSFRLGLTSGALDVSGPIGRNTTYMLALRRSWYDVLTIPLFAIVNHKSSEKNDFRYAFMDLNGKITHRFNDRATGFVSVYFGDDIINTKYKDSYESNDNSAYNDESTLKMHWGNIVGQAGFNYRITPELTSEFTGSYTRFFSSMHMYDRYEEIHSKESFESKSVLDNRNNIDDWIFHGDFDWQPSESSHVRFGAGYTLHRFLPQRASRDYSTNTSSPIMQDSTWSYTANEANLFIEDDWRIGDCFRMNAGIHGSLFSIDGKTHYGISPRLSLSYSPADNWAVKAAYSRTTQYVHQLCETYMSLPTDQWVPITGDMKPQTADKVSLGGYWQTSDGMYTVSLEGYFKYMRNLVDFRDEYYLLPPMDMWNRRLCTGRGTAKSIDLMIEKTSGRFTGHIAYSLGWADRTFPGKNGGVTFPARFDNRHTIKVLLNWNVSDKVQFSAAWTGHSGNRYTFSPQVWQSPNFDNMWYRDEYPLKAKINNYQFPFYHRLDLSCTVRNRRGYWNFSLYNAYCHMNTLTIIRDTDKNGRPVFKKVGILPIIPSISYTWQF